MKKLLSILACVTLYLNTANTPFRADSDESIPYVCEDQLRTQTDRDQLYSLDSEIDDGRVPVGGMIEVALSIPAETDQNTAKQIVDTVCDTIAKEISPAAIQETIRNPHICLKAITSISALEAVAAESTSRRNMIIDLHISRIKWLTVPTNTTDAHTLEILSNLNRLYSSERLDRDLDSLMPYLNRNVYSTSKNFIWPID